MILEDSLPGSSRGVSFFVTDFGWSVADRLDDSMVVLRSAIGPDARDFAFFAEP